MPGQALLCGQPGNTNWMPWEKKTKKKKTSQRWVGRNMEMERVDVGVVGRRDDYIQHILKEILKEFIKYCLEESPSIKLNFR